jgi:hypothetical protein
MKTKTANKTEYNWSLGTVPKSLAAAFKFPFFFCYFFFVRLRVVLLPGSLSLPLVLYCQSLLVVFCFP